MSQGIKYNGDKRIKKMTNYQKYRGTCEEECRKIISINPNDFELIRGHYFCPILNTDNAHWWLINKNDDSIYDPTKNQFPSRGNGAYTEFNGFFECAQCGKRIAENNIIHVGGNYVVCSGKCRLALVGLYKIVNRKKIKKK